MLQLHLAGLLIVPIQAEKGNLRQPRWRMAGKGIGSLPFWSNIVRGVLLRLSTAKPGEGGALPMRNGRSWDRQERNGQKERAGKRCRCSTQSCGRPRQGVAFELAAYKRGSVLAFQAGASHHSSQQKAPGIQPDLRAARVTPSLPAGTAEAARSLFTRGDRPPMGRTAVWRLGTPSKPTPGVQRAAGRAATSPRPESSFFSAAGGRFIY